VSGIANKIRGATKMANQDKPMNGKVCMVTGATSGIGKVTAQELAQQGASVIIVGRSPEKGVDVVDQIKKQTGSTVEFMLADLSVQQEIHRLVNQYNSEYQRLDVLINNAADVFFKRQMNVEGIEQTFATNHLGYFLVTNLLLDTLKASAPARIINVSSDVHRSEEINFENLQGEQKYNGYKAYRLSKLYNLYFTYELSRKLEGTGVTVNAVTPGLVKSKLGVEGGGFSSFMKKLINFIAGKSPEEGSQPIIYLATSSDVEGVTGKYFKNNEAISSSDASNDKETAQKLWDISAELTGLSDK